MTVMHRYSRLWPLLLCIWSAVVLASGRMPQNPPGRFFPLPAEAHQDADSFNYGQPVVGTTYFYWYDIDTKSHIIDHDGTDALTTHPADMNNLSYKRAAWHKTQIKDMIAAGLDFLLPVFWGVPGKYNGWSFVGLPPLVQAHSALQKEGFDPPAIGLFYDTSILKWNGFNKDGTSYHVDLSTDFGKEWFYTAIRDFFSLIPPSKWARVDSRPIIFIYSSAFAKKQDPNQFEYVKDRFRKDFAVEPFIIKSAGWEGQADAVYSWGGAVNGPLIYRHVIALGPGYDHRAVPGRAPLVVDRQDGKTYIDRWIKVLRLNPQHRPWIVHVETWNEWHEGTDIAHCREFGRSYIVLTRLFADMWHTKTVLKVPPPYPDGNTVSWQPGQPKGLDLLQSGGDGVWKKEKFKEVEAVVSQQNSHSDTSRYLYFNVDDAFAYGLYGKTVIVSVTYRDAGCSSFRLEYDNVNPQMSVREGAFRPVGNVALHKTSKWKNVEFTLPQCRFMNRCNGADFRIAVIGGDLELAISKVKLTK